jgi:site-specific recombinase XerD
MAVLYGTGVRIAELIGIQLSDIKRVDGCIRIIGKGNKEGGRTHYFTSKGETISTFKSGKHSHRDENIK